MSKVAAAGIPADAARIRVISTVPTTLLLLPIRYRSAGSGSGSPSKAALGCTMLVDTMLVDWIRYLSAVHPSLYRASSIQYPAELLSRVVDGRHQAALPS